MNTEETLGTRFQKFALPVFVNERNKYPLAAVWFVVAATLYLFSNHIHFFEPVYLQKMWIDHVTPFIPETVWIYLSEYFLFLSVYILCKDFTNASKYLYSFMTLQTISVLIFIIYPTTFNRADFPIPESTDPITTFIFNALRTVD